MANINKRMKQNIENQRLAHRDELTALETQQKQNKKKHTIKYIVKAAIIAAMYVGLTFAFFGLSFEVVQFRISEILVALVFFEPAAFPGLCIGCFIADILGPGGFYDAVFGTCATGFGIYIAKWYCAHNGKAPVGLALYAFFNAFMISLELSYSASLAEGKGVLVIFLWVLLGEAVTAVGGGSALYYLLRKRWKDIVGETAKSEEEEFIPTTLQ